MSDALWNFYIKGAILVCFLEISMTKGGGMYLGFSVIVRGHQDLDYLSLTFFFSVIIY